MSLRDPYDPLISCSLKVPSTNTVSFGDRAFSVAAPKLGNYFKHFKNYYFYYYYYVKFSTGIFPGRNIQSSVIPRPRTSSNFLRMCADPRSADFCIVLVRFLIPSCFKWPASFFDTEPNAPTTHWHHFCP